MQSLNPSSKGIRKASSPQSLRGLFLGLNPSSKGIRKALLIIKLLAKRGSGLSMSKCIMHQHYASECRSFSQKYCFSNLKASSCSCIMNDYPHRMPFKDGFLLHAGLATACRESDETDIFESTVRTTQRDH